MDNDEYVVFEPVMDDPAPVAWMPGLPQSSLSRMRSDDIFGQFAGIDVIRNPPHVPAASLGGAETVRVVTGRAGAEVARLDGMTVLRSPRMPLRLIPRVSATDAGPSGSGSGDAWGIAATAADRAGDLGGESVCVAVLDTGIDVHHPAFAGLEFDDENYRDFTGTGKADNVGHGTHCAGIIFGRRVDGVRIGVAPGVTHVLIGKVADVDVTTDTGVLQEALVWAVGRGANIISLSLGLDFLGYSRQFEERGYPPDVALSMALNDYRDHTRTFDRMMANVVSPGVAMKSALVIAACGNDSHADVEPMLRVQATLPAVADKVIAVGAVQRAPDGRYRLAPFSNSNADIVAPGVGVLSAKAGRGTTTMSGTSQAAPHVAGVAALWWQALQRQGRTPTPTMVRDEMMRAARLDLVPSDGDPAAIGAGLVASPIQVSDG